jgi:ectoine hydroxylase-related dioxygenase (phytanoyl-CoA dioxygenase family)|tara:strand:- start:197 stop:943 length:747 start_codon:yes stop_codon:yes gene_type:complete
MSYKIYKNTISNKISKKIFNLVLKNCNFYCPSLFDKNDVFKKTWSDPEFIKKMINFRKKNKKRFSAMYESLKISSDFQRMLFDSNLDLVAKKFLKVKRDELLVRGMTLRMDFPHDARNSYGWHQDNAYDKYNLNSKNGVVLWIPLIDTNERNGTLIIKPGSEFSTFQCSSKVNKGTKYKSLQLLVKEKFLKIYKSKSIDCKKNSALATYSGIFHKSGINLSDHIRFTIVVRFNNQFSKDFLFYRNLNI